MTLDYNFLLQYDGNSGNRLAGLFDFLCVETVQPSCRVQEFTEVECRWFTWTIVCNFIVSFHISVHNNVYPQAPLFFKQVGHLRGVVFIRGRAVTQRRISILLCTLMYYNCGYNTNSTEFISVHNLCAISFESRVS